MRNVNVKEMSGTPQWYSGFYLTDEECKFDELGNIIFESVCFYLTDEECKFWCDNARSGDRTRFYLTDEECKLASAIPAPAKIPEFLSN